MNKNNIEYFPKNLKNFRIHFVGIKGTGMAAFVEICSFRGAIVSGSDVSEHFYTDEILKKLNIIPTTFNKTNITSEIKLIIYSSAYKMDVNEELVQAKKLNIPCMLYSEALGALSSMSYSTGIAGVHGKTTTTGITGTLLKALSLPAQVLAGSVIKSFSSDENPLADGCCTLSIGNDFFVAETCEYQRHFMSFHPQNIILTSVESDHQDFYPTFNDIQNAFVDYAMLLPEKGNLIYCADDKGAVDTVDIIQKKRPDIQLYPYGENTLSDFMITKLPLESNMQHFKLNLFSNEVFSLSIPGLHNIKNASAAIILTLILIAKYEKVDSFNQLNLNKQKRYIEKIKKGLLDFKGSKRRSEIVGKIDNPKCLVIDDYGHHPTAVKTTLEGFREFYPDKYIIVDFMSHTYSRTAALLNEFANCFTSCDQVILHKIYGSARERKEDFENIVSGEILFERTKKYHKNVVYYEEILDALPYVKNLLNTPLQDNKNGFVLITMGAGDNWKLGTEILKEFNK